MSNNRPQDVADAIDALGDTPTPDDVYHATRDYDTRYIAAAAASEAKAGGGGGGGSQPVLVATKTLNNAEILALPTTAITVVAQPGGGFALVPLHATLRLTWVADYTGIDAGAVLFISGGAGTSLGLLTEAAGDVSSLLAFGEDSSAWLPPVAYSNIVGNVVRGSSGLQDSSSENTPIKLDTDNTLDFGGGDPGNSLKVTLLYYVVTL